MSAEHLAAAQNLLCRYCRALDRLDADLLRSLFTADAEIDMGAIYRGGRDGFVDIAMGFMGGMSATRHELSNVLIELGDDGAVRSEAYVRAWHRLDGEAGAQDLLVLGRYLNRFVREGGEWRIARHAELVDWGEMRPLNTDWFDANRELPKGERGRGDASYSALRP